MDDHQDDDWLPVPVAGRRGGFGYNAPAVIEPVVFFRKPRTAMGRRVERLRRRRVRGLVFDRTGVHAAGLIALWDDIADVSEPELWHQDAKGIPAPGPAALGPKKSAAAGYAIAISCHPPRATLLLFEHEFAAPLQEIRRTLLDLLDNPHARPTEMCDELPETFPYMRGMS